jgi:hypothetical protein
MFIHSKPQYPVREGFTLIGVSPPTGYGLIHDGILETYMVGRRRYVSATGIDACIERLKQNKKKPGPAPKSRAVA